MDAATYGERILIGAGNLAWCFDVDPSTLRRWAAEGVMPKPVMIGRSARWDVAELKEWIAGGCEPVGPEVEDSGGD